MDAVPSKADTVRQFIRRSNEFAPPGETLLHLFHATYGHKSITRPAGIPVFVVLTTHHITFVRSTWLSTDPIQTIATVPRSAIRFSDASTARNPLNAQRFMIVAETQNTDGYVEQWRLLTEQIWRDEAQTIATLVNATPRSNDQAH